MIQISYINFNYIRELKENIWKLVFLRILINLRKNRTLKLRPLFNSEKNYYIGSLQWFVKFKLYKII